MFTPALSPITTSVQIFNDLPQSLKVHLPVKSAKSELKAYRNVSWCVPALGFVIPRLIILSCLITPVVLAFTPAAWQF
jgi:hypothetical protein